MKRGAFAIKGSPELMEMVGIVQGNDRSPELLERMRALADSVLPSESTKAGWLIEAFRSSGEPS